MYYFTPAQAMVAYAYAQAMPMVEIVASCYAVETMAQILCYQGRSQEFFGR